MRAPPEGWTRSIFNTSAPSSASNIPHIGHGPIPASSMTLVPCSGPIFDPPPRREHCNECSTVATLATFQEKRVEGEILRASLAEADCR